MVFKQSPVMGFNYKTQTGILGRDKRRGNAETNKMKMLKQLFFIIIYQFLRLILSGMRGDQ
jgi:hypothetical protein